jgi:hypothetical protein
MEIIAATSRARFAAAAAAVVLALTAFAVLLLAATQQEGVPSASATPSVSHAYAAAQPDCCSRGYP